MLINANRLFCSDAGTRGNIERPNVKLEGITAL